MAGIGKKINCIIEQEENFAARLAAKVIDKPKLSIWMILIPFIFVFYFFQLQKAVKGRWEFAENYMITRKRIIYEAKAVVESGGKRDIGGLARMSGAPEKAFGEYKKLLAVLFDHYTDLLRAKGEDFESIVKYAYKTHTNFLIFLHRLNQAEKVLHAALRPSLADDSGGSGRNH